MEKINRKHHELLVLLCLLYSPAFTQSKSGMENYNLIKKDKEYVWMPVVHYQTRKGIYTEFRYNYDDVRTASLYFGKAITGGKEFNYSITPMAGFSFGNFRSIAGAAKMDFNYHKFFASAETQYSHALDNEQASFFFAWPEMGINFSSIFFGGIAAQYTYQLRCADLDPGIMFGVSFKNVSIPGYIFRPANGNEYVVLGIMYEYDLKRKK